MSDNYGSDRESSETRPKKLRADGSNYEAWIASWETTVTARAGSGEVLNTPLVVPDPLPQVQEEKFFAEAPTNEDEAAATARRLRAKILEKLVKRIEEYLRIVIHAPLGSFSHSDPTAVIQFLRNRYGRRTGYSRMFYRTQYIDRVKLKGETWVQCVDDIFIHYSNYVRNGGHYDDVDLIT